MFWVDWVILAAIGYGLWQGFLRGFLAQIFQIVSVFIALFLSFWLFGPVGNWFESQLQLPVSFARPLALAILFFVSSFVLQMLASLIHKVVAPVIKANPVNRSAGLVLGGARQTVIVSLILAVLVTLPLPTRIKSNIDNAYLSKPLIRLALGMETALAKVFHDDTLKSLSYRTVDPGASTTTSLNYTEDHPTIDLQGELQMLALTNAARVKDGAGPLLPNDSLREVARAHAKDMLAKGYFAHISPQGKDGLARVQDAHITVLEIGENLATAPTINLAQAGLWASPGHRKNILHPDFNQVGIGVLDAGKHGKMVVEVFAKIP